MFPQLRERIGPVLDLVVEFSTLGEYRLGADGTLCAASALAPAPGCEPQLGGDGAHGVARAAVRRIVAGGAAGTAPAATPAARRLLAAPGRRLHRHADRQPRHGAARPRTPVAPEQLCLAI